MDGEAAMRPFASRFGHQRGLYALACDEEASAYYGIEQQGILCWLWRVRCYLLGFFGR